MGRYILHIRESRALMNDVLMHIYLTSQFPCMHTRIESRKNGDELVMKSPVIYLWQFGDEKSSNISLATR